MGSELRAEPALAYVLIQLFHGSVFQMAAPRSPSTDCHLCPFLLEDILGSAIESRSAVVSGTLLGI